MPQSVHAKISKVESTNFFPERPRHVTLHQKVGIITYLGSSLHNAIVTIMLPNGKEEDIFLGADIKLSGSYATECITIGTDSECEKWPAGYILGKTRVIVTYWYEKYYNFLMLGGGQYKRIDDDYQIVKVTDKIELAAKQDGR